MPYDKSCEITVLAAFTDANGALTDPTTVICKTKAPDGTLATYSGGSVTHVSTGNYSVALSSLTPGVWSYRFEATGTIKAGAEGSFVISDSSFA